VSLPFERKLFDPVRLQIVALLEDNECVPFKDLKKVLNLSDGNLVSHMRALEQCGLIDVSKAFVGRKPQTSYKLTQKGKDNFTKLLNWFFDEFSEATA